MSTITVEKQLEQIEVNHTQKIILSNIVSMVVNVILINQTMNLADYVMRLIGCPC